MVCAPVRSITPSLKLGVYLSVQAHNPCSISHLYPATRQWLGIMVYLLVSSIRPSVRPCSPFPIDNLSIHSRNFFKFFIHIVVGDECYGIVNRQNSSIFIRVTALVYIGKIGFWPVTPLLFVVTE